MLIDFSRRTERAPFLVPQNTRRARWRFFFASLRQSLYIFLRGRAWRSVLLPDYVPQGIYDPFLKLGHRLVFYPVRSDLRLDRKAFRYFLHHDSPDLVVYIHYFGLYNEDDIAWVQETVDGRAVLLEDFAHSLPGSSVTPRGDLLAFSFTKTLGVSEGGLLWSCDKDFGTTTEYGDSTPLSEELSTRLQRNLSVNSFLAANVGSRMLAGLARRMLSGYTRYYPFLMGNYTEINAPVSRPSHNLLRHVDFGSVTRRRQALAALYLERLPPSLLFGSDKQTYLRQSLYGFPVQVGDPAHFDAYLRKFGIRGAILRENWWYRGSDAQSSAINSHYLLPISHYLRDKDVISICSRVNAYKPDLCE